MRSEDRKFLFTLAGHLKKTVAELESTLTVDEFIEWQVMFLEHPFGHFADHLQSALVGSAVASRLCRPAVSYDKLLVKFAQPKNTSDETRDLKMRHTFLMYAQMHNAAIKKAKGA